MHATIPAAGFQASCLQRGDTNSDMAELSNLRNPHSKTRNHGFESQWVNYSKITSAYYPFTESSIYSLCELNSKL